VLAELKPLISALVLPPASPLLLVAFGLMAARRWPAFKAATAVGLLLAWGLSTTGGAVWLNDHLLEPPAPRPELLQRPASTWAPTPQAVVILGGGASGQAAQWPDQHGLRPLALARLDYGLALGQAWRLPVAYSGGMGWAADGSQRLSEAAIAQAVATRWGQPLRWLETDSRDTQENAQHSARLLQPLGIHRIALVTQAWHMPRAQQAFEAAGFEVLSAPMGAIRSDQPGMLRWLPSPDGVLGCRLVLHEWLGQLAARWGVLP
jgi:uncharacterized SAM-binding protein YcdF (DUF218 family)